MSPHDLGMDADILIRRLDIQTKERQIKKTRGRSGRLRRRISSTTESSGEDSSGHWRGKKGIHVSGRREYFV